MLSCTVCCAADNCSSTCSGRFYHPRTQVITFILLQTSAVQGLWKELSFLTPVIPDAQKCNPPAPSHSRR